MGDEWFAWIDRAGVKRVQMAGPYAPAGVRVDHVPLDAQIVAFGYFGTKGDAEAAKLALKKSIDDLPPAVVARIREQVK